MSKINHLVWAARNLFTASILFCLMLASPVANALPPTFSKAFSPSTIGPGSVSTLTFTIDNSSESLPASSLSFTDTLPMAVTIASPANASSNCLDAVFTAPNGGGSISMSDGAVAAGGSCTLSVDVTSSTPGTHTNPLVTLTSSQGTSNSASADLTVVTSLPGFSKSFSPSAVLLGQRSTLSFTIDNTANAAVVGSLDFTDNLPTGMIIASPANAITDCVSAGIPDTTLTATSGTSTIILDADGSNLFAGFEVLPAGATCTVSVDVVATGVGSLDNITGDLLADFTASGKASATLDVTTEPLSVAKSFTDDPVTPGSTVELEYTITNRDRNDAATAIAFTDDLDAALTGLTASSVDTNTCSATVDISTPSLIDVSGGSVAANGGSCTIGLSLAVPGMATEGSYPSTTSSVSATIGGTPGSYSPATETLYVQAVPVLTKTFTDDPVAAGGSVTLEFTITNPSPTLAATDIAFTDELTTFLSYPVSASLPTAGFCGAGAAMALIVPGIDRQALSMTGGDLAAGASCTFSVTIDIPTAFPGNVYTNTTSNITATINGTTRTGNPASDDLVVLGAPTISKEFTNDPVAPGNLVTLVYTISHNAQAPGDASNIAFSDPLDPIGALTGTTVNSVLTDTCRGTPAGVGSGTFSYTGGGSLPPGGSCVVSIDLAVLAAATPGTYSSTSAALTADVGDGASSTLPTTGNAATDSLLVTGLVFSKEFIDDPVLPGGTTTLRFTLDNTTAPMGQDATSIIFTDSLASILPGTTDISALGLPATVCGGSLSGTTFLIFSGGSVPAGTSCSFDVTLEVPVGTVDGTYTSTTSSLNATVNAAMVVLPAVADAIVVNSSLLMLSKSFTDDPVTPGSTVTLEYTLTNLDSANAASAIAFTDDLDAALTGLTASSVAMNTCSATVDIITDPAVIDVSGGAIAAAGSCTISLSLAVPAGTSLGTAVLSTSSSVTGTVGGLAVTGSPATDTLLVESLSLSQAFLDAGTVLAGGTVVLRFTLDNLNSSSGVSSLAFSSDLSTALTGLVATGLPLNDVCGAGSQLDGSSFLALTGGSLPASGSCSFDVTLQVPLTAFPGDYISTTGSVTSSGITLASPATDTLTVDPTMPVFSKAFAPTSIVQGATSTLTFTVDNSASLTAATALDFTDTMPAALTVASPANASTTCTGGTLTAVSTTGSVSYSGGSVAAAASCTISVDVTSVTVGTHLNTTGDLTSSAGNSGMASASLTITLTPPPVFSKGFSPTSIMAGSVSTLTFTIDNTVSYLAAGTLGFTDNMPSGMAVANPANASTDCTGGTLTATAGSNVISYSGGSLAGWNTCTVQVDVTAATSGSYVNTTGNLNSSLGSSGTASATLTVTIADSDGDGVDDNGIDQCPGTVIPESVPTISQYAGYYALFDGDRTFDTINDAWRPTATTKGTFTLDDTAGCSCEQIIAEQGLAQVYTEYGCDLNVLRDWISQLPSPGFAEDPISAIDALR